MVVNRGFAETMIRAIIRMLLQYKAQSVGKKPPLPRVSLALLGSMILVGCVHTEFGPVNTQIGSERLIQLQVDENTLVDVHLPPGEITVGYLPGSELSASMVLYCPSEGSRCDSKLNDLDFVVSRNGNRLTIKINKNFSKFINNSKVVTRLNIPSVRTLEISTIAGDVHIGGIVAQRLDVNLKAGDLDIIDIQACLKVDQGAGDVSIRMAEDFVASVKLDAGVGDVSLRDRGGYHAGKRAWLIGAELDWHSGHRGCDMEVDLQAGNVQVTLN